MKRIISNLVALLVALTCTQAQTTTKKKSPSKKSESSGTAAGETAPAKKKVAPKTVLEETTAPLPAEPSNAATKTERATNATIEPSELTEFAAQPARIQQLITAALELPKLNLTYTFGSADPAKGGMDCSGTMYYLLRSQGFKEVPRDSSGQYVWARQQGTFFAVISKSAESFEFKNLQPGDLLFWTGTYTTGREVPISHVMLYLGTEKKTQKRVMFGASDGRSYNGIQRWGVSVFDFKMPRIDPAKAENAQVDFVGYARIPSLREGGDAPLPAAVETPSESTTPTSVKKPAATPKPKANTGKKKPRKSVD